MTPGKGCGGVRPSSGAATSAGDGDVMKSGASASSGIAAPGDGRTPPASPPPSLTHSLTVARPPRLERGTLCLEGRCSIQLSYGRCRDSIEPAGNLTSHIPCAVPRLRLTMPARGQRASPGSWPASRRVHLDTATGARLSSAAARAQGMGLGILGQRSRSVLLRLRTAALRPCPEG